MAFVYTLTEFSNTNARALLKSGVSTERLVALLRKMLRIRRFEEKVEELYLVRGQLIGPSHLYIGQEAIAIGVAGALSPDDLVISTYRGHGHAIAKDVPTREIMAELFGRATGTCKGLGGSMHAAIYPEKGILFASAIVGAGIPMGAGIGLALKQRQDKRLVTVFFGDGAANSGAFHEGINMAAIWKLPVLYVCENNMYAMGTTTGNTTAARNLVDRGIAYDIHTISVDGNDVLSIFAAASKASRLIRDGEGPVFFVARTYRMKGHGVYDKAEYRPKGEAEAWVGKDPISRFEKTLLDANLITDKEISAINEEVRMEIEDSVEFSVNSPYLSFDNLWKFMYA